MNPDLQQIMNDAIQHFMNTMSLVFLLPKLNDA